MEILCQDYRVVRTKDIDVKKKHVEYVLTIITAEKSWKISKRYNDFLHLHKALKKSFGLNRKAMSLPPLPPKLIFGNLQKNIILKRKTRLQQYLNSCIRNKEICESAVLNRFLNRDAAGKNSSSSSSTQANNQSLSASSIFQNPIEKLRNASKMSENSSLIKQRSPDKQNKKKTGLLALMGSKIISPLQKKKNTKAGKEKQLAFFEEELQKRMMGPLFDNKKFLFTFYSVISQLDQTQSDIFYTIVRELEKISQDKKSPTSASLKNKGKHNSLKKHNPKKKEEKNSISSKKNAMIEENEEENSFSQEEEESEDELSESSEGSESTDFTGQQQNTYGSSYVDGTSQRTPSMNMYSPGMPVTKPTEWRKMSVLEFCVLFYRIKSILSEHIQTNFTSLDVASKSGSKHALNEKNEKKINEKNIEMFKNVLKELNNPFFANTTINCELFLQIYFLLDTIYMEIQNCPQRTKLFKEFGRRIRDLSQNFSFLKENMDKPHEKEILLLLKDVRNKRNTNPNANFPLTSVNLVSAQLFSRWMQKLTEKKFDDDKINYICKYFNSSNQNSKHTSKKLTQKLFLKCEQVVFLLEKLSFTPNKKNLLLALFESIDDLEDNPYIIVNNSFSFDNDKKDVTKEIEKFIMQKFFEETEVAAQS